MSLLIDSINYDCDDNQFNIINLLTICVSLKLKILGKLKQQIINLVLTIKVINGPLCI